MPLIIHTSGLRLARLETPRSPQTEVSWPVRRNGRTVMMQIDPQRIPAGWQSVMARVPMRLATCRETDCPMYLQGWTEITTGDGNRQPRVGAVTGDEAAAIYGYHGAASRPPATIVHSPGTPCPRIHKLPSGASPVYRVNGALMEETAFLDAIGEGIYAQQRRTQKGSY